MKEGEVSPSLQPATQSYATPSAGTPRNAPSVAKKNGKQGDTLLTVFLQLPKCANYFFKITNDFAGTLAGSVALSVGVPLKTSTAFV